MFQSITTLFKHRTIIRTLQDKLRAEQRDHTNTKAQLNAAQRKLEESTKAKDSGPWIQIIGADYDPSHGFRIEVDWNKEFIKCMHDEGINGPTEEATVQRWLAMMNLNIIDGLEAESVEADPRGTVADVVTDKHLLSGNENGY